MKFFKKCIPIALTMFAITLISRITLNDGNFEFTHLISASVMAIVITLSTAFFDSHPMNDEE